MDVGADRLLQRDAIYQCSNILGHSFKAKGDLSFQCVLTSDLNLVNVLVIKGFD